jgi:hypothetical protein
MIGRPQRAAFAALTCAALALALLRSVPASADTYG